MASSAGVEAPGPYGNPGTRDAEVAVVRSIYDAFARRDVDAALEHVSQDVELHVPHTAELAGRQAPYRGHAGVRAYFADADRVWRELTLHADDIRAAAGAVVVFGHVEGITDAGPVRRNAMWTWRIEDGCAVSVRVHDLGDA
jgi:ketosteroid isomerase-like protein